MELIYLLFMILVVCGLINIDRLLKKKLENDERIIERLDLLRNEGKERN